MKTVSVVTELEDSAGAGGELALGIREGFPGSPGAIIVFAAPSHDHEALLRALREHHPDCLIVGASSAGEFTGTSLAQGQATALAIGGDDVQLNASVGRGLKASPANAGGQIVDGYRGGVDARFAHRAALVLTDALAGYTDALVDELTLLTDGQCQFFGGGAGDNANFLRTSVFFGNEVLTDAAVSLEILSNQRIGIGLSHGWEPASAPMRVTEAEGLRLISLDGMPAVEAFEGHAEAIGHALDTLEPIPYFLHNIVGIDTGSGYRLRVPLAVLPDGSVQCAAEVPSGSVVRFMRSSARSAAEAAERATEAAMASLNGARPGTALLFDCVATRLRLGDDFRFEIKAVADKLRDVPLIGCNTHGQIGRTEGQFAGFHNCTAVVCLFPA